MIPKYKVSAVNHSEFFSIHKNEYGQYEVGEGTDALLMKVLAEKLNFRYEIVVPEDNHWGSKTEDGNWTGMIGMIQREEADFSIEVIGVTSERAEAVHFSFPYLIDTTTFAMRTPSLLPKDFVFVYPFSFIVWMLIGLSILISSWLLSVFNNHDPQSKRNMRHPKFSQFAKNLELLIALFLGQGSTKTFKKLIERIFLFFWALSKSVLVFSYAGVLLSFLMVPLKEPAIKTILDLRNAVVNGNARCLGLKGSRQMDIIMNAESGILKDLGDSLRQHPEDVVYSEDEIVERLEQGKCAIFCPALISNVVFTRKGADDIFLANDPLGHNPYSVAFRKDFCCIRKFDRLILRVQAAGLYEKWIRDMILRLRLKAKSKPDVDYIRPLSLKDVFGTFWILPLGYVLSLTVFALEIVVHRYIAKRH